MLCQTKILAVSILPLLLGRGEGWGEESLFPPVHGEEVWFHTRTQFTIVLAFLKNSDSSIARQKKLKKSLALALFRSIFRNLNRGVEQPGSSSGS